MVAESQSWRGRRVLITGHTGFKGSWLALWLSELGAVVCGYALDPPTKPSLFELARVGDRLEDVRADIRDTDQLQQTMSHFAPEVVFHLAAQPLVRPSYQEPSLTYSTNVMGTVNVLEAIRSTPSVRAAVCVTTDKCYENREWPWGYREGDRLGGQDPYSSSKACAELVCAAWRQSFFSRNASRVVLATARAGNVIGGGDWAAERLLPDLLRGFIDSRCVAIRHPHAVRPWQHVLEPLRGYLALAERLQSADSDFASAWNFGPDDEDAQSVAWIADRIAGMWRGPAQWQSEVSASDVHEATCLKLDCSKAHSGLGWRPALDLDAALKLTVDWTQQWQEGADMQRVTLGQIADYQQLCNGSRAFIIPRPTQNSTELHP